MSSSLRSITLIASLCATQALCADDAVVGTGTPASCTETTFNSALTLLISGIQAPGGTMTFNCGTNAHTIRLSSQKFLNGQVVIDGGNKITLDGQALTRVFRVDLDGPVGEALTEVTLKNIDLNRGNSGAEPFGGAILVNANTRLDGDIKVTAQFRQGF